jgi:hypothetical protein
MSSTNRSNTRDEHIADYYITPIEKISEFLNVFVPMASMDVENFKILDPCAGGDDKHLMSYPEALKAFGFKNIDTLDLRKDSLANVKTNYLTYSCKDKYDMIITNPPFNLAREIIEKALDDVKEGGYVIMLLRLNFFGSRARRDLWDIYFPSYSFVHHKRIGFTRILSKSHKKMISENRIKNKVASGGKNTNSKKRILNNQDKVMK